MTFLLRGSLRTLRKRTRDVHRRSPECEPKKELRGTQNISGVLKRTFAQTKTGGKNTLRFATLMFLENPEFLGAPKSSNSAEHRKYPRTRHESPERNSKFSVSLYLNSTHRRRIYSSSPSSESESESEFDSSSAFAAASSESSSTTKESSEPITESDSDSDSVAA